MFKILKIKQSSALLSAIHGIGSVGLGFFVFHLTGLLFLGYLAAFIMLAVCVWIVIDIQDDRHKESVAYLDIVLFFLNLIWIGLGFSWGWIASVVLFLAFIIVGFRTDRTPVPTVPKTPETDDSSDEDDIEDEQQDIEVEQPENESTQ